MSNNRPIAQLSTGDGSSAGGARRPSGAEEGEAACRGRRGGGSASPTSKEAQGLSDSCSGSEPPVFFAVGRLVEKKGYVHLVEAAKLLKDRGVKLTVRIIGGGPDHHILSKRIAELDVGEIVKLEGAMKQEELLPLLRQAEAFVLPCVQAKDGDQDGIPVSLMEAMAYGIPCVSTTVSGVPELIEDGKEGLLVPEKDPPALASALERLALDPALRQRLGRSARKKVEAEFTLAGLVQGLDALYSESCGGDNQRDTARAARTLSF